MKYVPRLLFVTLLCGSIFAVTAGKGTAAEADEKALRAANIERAHQALTDVGSDKWAALLADDVVWEYPFGRSVGVTERVAGKDHVVQRLRSFFALVNGLRIYDMVSMTAEDPNIVITEYKGEYGLDKAVVQKYITMHKFKDGKLVQQREFWDTKIVSDIMALIRAKKATSSDEK